MCGPRTFATATNCEVDNAVSLAESIIFFCAGVSPQAPATFFALRTSWAVDVATAFASVRRISCKAISAASGSPRHVMMLELAAPISPAAFRRSCRVCNGEKITYTNKQVPTLPTNNSLRFCYILQVYPDTLRFLLIFTASLKADIECSTASSKVSISS